MGKVAIFLSLFFFGLSFWSCESVNYVKNELSSIGKGSRKLNRRLETPSKTQAEVLSCFGYYVDESGVLQIIKH
jgi:hypothetical protein